MGGIIDINWLNKFNNLILLSCIQKSNISYPPINPAVSHRSGIEVLEYEEGSWFIFCFTGAQTKKIRAVSGRAKILPLLLVKNLKKINNWFSYTVASRILCFIIFHKSFVIYQSNLCATIDSLAIVVLTMMFFWS